MDGWMDGWVREGVSEASHPAAHKQTNKGLFHRPGPDGGLVGFGCRSRCDTQTGRSESPRFFFFVAFRKPVFPLVHFRPFPPITNQTSAARNGGVRRRLAVGLRARFEHLDGLTLL